MTSIGRSEPTQPLSRSGSQRLLVPAYFTPSQEKWQTMCGAIYKSLATAVLVMNPRSGPGKTADPNYRAATDYCRGHRQAVIGYVYTDRASRPLSQVTSEIDRYYLFYPWIRGIFFDEMSNDETDKAYYRMLYEYVKSKTPKSSLLALSATLVPLLRTAARSMTAHGK